MPAKLTDTLNYLSKLTLHRLLNMLKVFVSFCLTRLLGKPVQWGLPFTLSIEPTTACNLRCPECPSGLRAFTRPTGNLKPDFFRQIIDDTGRALSFLIFYFQGEPYINPDFLDMVAYAQRKKIYTITSTNGHFLNDENARRTVESGLDRIIISIDGATQDVYEQYRVEGKLETVIAGARNLIAWKKKLRSATPYVIFQMLVVRPNEHQIEAVRELARNIGVDELKLKTAQVYNYAGGNALIPENNQYARYRRNPDGSWSPKHAIGNFCWKLWHAAVVTWDGRVVPCCFDKDAQHTMGDLKTTGFGAVWQGAAYRKFRRTILSGRENIDICTNCSEGCRVWR